VSRRQRLRAAAIEEIKLTARRILVAQGPAAVTLRAIAREMGMTAPALYRYFDRHDDLLLSVAADLLGELGEVIRAAIESVPDADLITRFVAGSRGFRQWAIGHRSEYALLFGSPIPGLETINDEVVAICGRELAVTFISLFVDLWSSQPFPVLRENQFDPVLVEQLEDYREVLDASLPIGVIHAFLTCWIRLLGQVSLEVFGHLAFAFHDLEPMFELLMAELAEVLGLKYVPLHVSKEVEILPLAPHAARLGPPNQGGI
jgi:AcrR family transcriptional regulator